MNKEAIVGLFVQYVLPVLFSGVALLLGRLLHMWTTKLEADASRSRMENIGLKVAHFGELAFSRVEQELRPLIAAASADGVLTTDEKLRLREAALVHFRLLLGEEGRKELQDVLGVAGGAVNEYLTNKLEQIVSSNPTPENLKKSGMVPPANPS